MDSLLQLKIYNHLQALNNIRYLYNPLVSTITLPLWVITCTYTCLLKCLTASLPKLKVWEALGRVYPCETEHQRRRPRRVYFWIPSSSFCLYGFLFIHCLDSYIHTHTYCDIPYRQADTHAVRLLLPYMYKKDPLSFALNCTYRVFNSPIRMPANTISTTYVHVHSKCPLMQLCCWVRVHVCMHAPVNTYGFLLREDIYVQRACTY